MARAVTLSGRSPTSTVCAAREHSRALHLVLELAHVAGPGVVARRRSASSVKPGSVLVLDGVRAQEVLGEQGHVLAALAQRRQRHGDHVQPIVEVLAEPPLLTSAARSRLRRGDERTSTLLVASAEPLELALLQHAQQLGLDRRAAARRSRRGTACRRGPARTGPPSAAAAPVNAPFSWPNSSDSSRRLGQRRAVDRDERPVAAAAAARGWRGRPAPCRSRSRREEHGGGAVGHLLRKRPSDGRGHFNDPAHEAQRHQVAFAPTPAPANPSRSRRDWLLGERRRISRLTMEHNAELLQIDGLLQIVGGAFLHRGDGRFPRSRTPSSRAPRRRDRPPSRRAARACPSVPPRRRSVRTTSNRAWSANDAHCGIAVARE